MDFSKPPSATQRRIFTIAALALALILFLSAAIIHRNNPGSAAFPAAIQSVFPGPDENVLRQSAISVDLAAGYTGQIEVNGLVIPEDELFRAQALNLIRFQPGPDTSIERLLPDLNCVRVEYWLESTGPVDSRLYNWCFFTS